MTLFTVMDNYKNVPQFLYDLSPSQMEMFMTDDNPYNRQSKKVTEYCRLQSMSLSSIQKSWIHKWEKHIREKKMIARMEREQIIWRDRMPLFGVLCIFVCLQLCVALAGNK
nr:uncharacterized protein LOC109782337 [Aegilops tauschii subsp. strangulata]XP_040249167.1 uncharacterized protein LOC109782337 [Aegilops tauschii subsp. strangulata]